MSARIRAHKARFHPRAEWTQAMMMAAIDALQKELAALKASGGNPARIAEIEAVLGKSEPQKSAMFDAEALADLIRENEPHADAQRRWQSDYNQLNNRLVDARLPPLSDNERALLNRLQRALYAGRKGAVETI